MTENVADRKPLAGLSLDLDNQWSYMKTHGDSGWESYPSYLDVFVPVVLEQLVEHELTITFFIVGQDAALTKNHAALAQLTDHGHEIGNHSFHHEQWMIGNSRDELHAELGQAQAAIESATGQTPEGFRGPGFCWSPALLDVLEEAGFVYDASTLPTYIGPLARMYYFRTASLTDNEKEKRKHLFGGLADGLQPVRPYWWDLGDRRRLLEIPVTTMPVFKVPFHLSYLLYLSRFSIGLMTAYLRWSLALCRRTKTSPSFLLHPLDLIGPEHVPELAFFPGMDLGMSHKQAVFSRVIAELRRWYTPVAMNRYAEHVMQQVLASRSPGSGVTQDKAAAA